MLSDYWLFYCYLRGRFRISNKWCFLLYPVKILCYCIRSSLNKILWKHFNNLYLLCCIVLYWVKMPKYHCYIATSIPFLGRIFLGGIPFNWSVLGSVFYQKFVVSVDILSSSIWDFSTFCNSLPFYSSDVGIYLFHTWHPP